jgi:hypothetical protein
MARGDRWKEDFWRRMIRQPAGSGRSVRDGCRPHDIDPFAYLRDVLTRLPAIPINQLDHLLPHRWARSA